MILGGTKSVIVPKLLITKISQIFIDKTLESSALMKVYIFYKNFFLLQLIASTLVRSFSNSNNPKALSSQNSDTMIELIARLFQYIQTILLLQTTV